MAAAAVRYVVDPCQHRYNTRSRKRSAAAIDDNSHSSCINSSRRFKNSIIIKRKMPLVLDLDHTLLHTITEERLQRDYHSPLLQTLVENPKGKMLYRFKDEQGNHHWTKLRPGVREFLYKASQLYDLHVCTMGTKAYAQRMCQLLDPYGVLFSADKIMSREDFLNTNKNGKKKMKDLHCFTSTFFKDELFVIVDDTPKVWSSQQQQLNLLRIEKYVYFPMARHIHNQREEANFTHSDQFCRDAVVDEDGSVIHNMLKVLEEVHQGYNKALQDLTAPAP